MIGFPKPERRATTKRRRARRARKVIQSVRDQCVARDGYCRIAQACIHHVGPCAGRSEWAHFGEHARARTRGQAPERRHTTAGSLMLCTYHHREYDAHRLTITAMTHDGCDGALTYRRLA